MLQVVNRVLQNLSLFDIVLTLDYIIYLIFR